MFDLTWRLDDAPISAAVGANIVFKRRPAVATDPNIEWIHQEINRLALETTDPAPLALFAERETLLKRMQAWKVGSLSVSIVIGIIAAFGVFHGEWQVIQGGFTALVFYIVLLLIGRFDVDARAGAWLNRARAVVGQHNAI